jgi:hypothetical protein
MRTAIQEDNIVSFYDNDGYLVGQVDYTEKSQHYIDDAMENWTNGVMTVETVERYSNWHYSKDGYTFIGTDMSFSKMRNK